MTNETILVVDDDKEIVKILRTYLEQEGFHVLTAYQGGNALHILRREHPDLLLLDLMLPDKDGRDITRFIRKDASLRNIPIIMITARIDDSDKIVGLELGADDYITKPFNAREVIARIRALLRRTQNEDMSIAEVYQMDELRLDTGERQLFVRGKRIKLTPTEFKLLSKLMAHPGYTFSRDELLLAGLGVGYEGFGRTLDTHIGNLRKKIEPDPKNPTYIETMYSIGYRFKRD